MTLDGFLYLCGGLLIGLLGPAIKEFFLSKVRGHVQHRYDRRLEYTKAELAQDAAFHHALFSTFVDGQKAVMERKLWAVDKTWQELVAFRNKLPAVLGFTDYLTVDEYKEAKESSSFQDLVAQLSEDKIVSLNFSSIESARPYIGEYIWLMVYAYRAVFVRITLLLFWGKNDAEKLLWHEDSGIQQLLRAVLSKKEMNSFDRQKFGKIIWLQRCLEEKILSNLRKIISGESSVEPSVEQIKLIKDAVAKEKIKGEAINESLG